MRGKHMDIRTMLMSVHIVNKGAGQETAVNYVGPSCTQRTKPNIVDQLLLEYDVELSEQEDVELGEGCFSLGDDDVDEKAYLDVAVDPDRMENKEYLIDPNFESDYGIDEDEEVKDEEMDCNYDDEDEDIQIIHFDKDDNTIDEVIFLRRTTHMQLLLLQ